MLKILIVGATSGIGRELARIYARAGHRVGVTGRRQELLDSLRLEYPNQIVTECYDAALPGSTPHLESLVHQLGGLDLLIYNAGYGDLTEDLDWTVDKATVDINVNGFLETIHFGWSYFTRQGHGHLATTSSIAANRGNGHSPAYSASKAFQSTYFEGLHIKARKMSIPLYVTDIQPGFVDTKMAKGPRLSDSRRVKENVLASNQIANDGPSAKSPGVTFWVAPVEKAAQQIARAIEQKKWRVYITRRWWLIAKLFRWLPDWIYHRIG